MRLLLVWLVCGLAGISSTINDTPIIGILSVPYKTAPCETVTPANKNINYTSKAPHGKEGCFSSFYVKWLEQGGARVVPLLWDWSEKELYETLEQINGVLFTGGGLDLVFGTPYMTTANRIFQKAKEMNDKGDYFPVWGTCMGFQLLSILGAQNTSVLKTHAFDSEALSLPLIFTPTAASSRLFRNAPASVYNALGTEPITTNLHHDGVPPYMFVENKNLSSFYDLISINYDRKAHLFSSTLEAKNYPIYGTQWHPERPEFEWEPQNNISHTYSAIKSMQYPADFFVNEARKNMHKYKNKQQEEAALIYNYSPVHYGGSYLVYYV